jgi:DNA-binding NtrC family response regulator
MTERIPWITCYLTDILISYVRDHASANRAKIDYPALFRDARVIETPANPEAFLTDVNNWVPLSVLRALEIQCERISGAKDVAYHAAKAYFAPERKKLPSLFEVIVQVLNDLRPALHFANLWGSSQSNYIALQTIDKPGAPDDLYVLCRFDEITRPSIGSLNLLRGFCEGFLRLYPFVEEVQCVEEFSQLSLQDIVGEFPDYFITIENDVVEIRHRTSKQTVVIADKIFLASEVIAASPDAASGAIVAWNHGQITLPRAAAAPVPASAHGTPAQRVVKAGVLSHGLIAFALHEGRYFGAPYSRFTVSVRHRAAPQTPISADRLRQHVSQLLFEHLRQTNQNQIRMVEVSVERQALAQENDRLRTEVQRQNSFAGILGHSDKMRELFGLIRSVADTDVTVLIHGETGTGKELIARAIHYNGTRKDRRFIAVNCGALSLNLLESELFGHEKGAFTGAIAQKKGFFEVANGGTLFLDEIGEIPTSTQVKLLRVLQEGEFQRVGGTDTIKVDVRIIAATNQNLEERIAKGEFRQDLYYRLKVFPLTVPSLRERIEDIPLLVSHFIEKCSQVTKRPVKEITPEAMGLLMAHDWPGNIRELENVIQRMMVVSKGELLDLQDLSPEMRAAESPGKAQAKGLKGISRGSAELVEKHTIVDALAKTGWNVTHAAKALGISRATLQTKMKAFGLRQTKA